MDDINHIINPFSSPLKPNIFKYLFIICFFALLTVTIFSYFILNSKFSKQPLLVTATTENTVSYKASSVLDDTTFDSKLILIDQNQKKSLVKLISYYKINDQIVKPIFNDFVFSSDYGFLYYRYGSGDKQINSILWDVKNINEKTLNFPAETKGFTSDSRYFYACAQGGTEPGGAVIVELSRFKNIFSQNKTFICRYDQEKKEVIFSELEEVGSKMVVSEYTLSEKTGKILKTK